MPTQVLVVAGTVALIKVVVTAELRADRIPHQVHHLHDRPSLSRASNAPDTGRSQEESGGGETLNNRDTWIIRATAA